MTHLVFDSTTKVLLLHLSCGSLTITHIASPSTTHITSAPTTVVSSIGAVRVPRLLHQATILNLHHRHIAFMKIPDGLLTVQGKKAAGAVYLQGTDGQYLREYGTAQDGIYSTCLVLTAPGDIITGSFVLEPGLADHVDLVVDGIRRESSSSSGSDKSFNRMYKRACYQEKKNNRTGGLKSCAMMIQTRKADKDIPWTGDGPPSTVGTVEIQLFRLREAATPAAITNGQKNILRDGLDKVKRAPTFREFSSWRDLNPYIDLGTSLPSFEVGFTERRQLAKFKADRTIQEWPGSYTLVACLRFKYCSAADLIALGFKDVPSYQPSPPPDKHMELSKSTLKMGSSEASPQVKEGDMIEKHAGDDGVDSLFFEDQIQEPPVGAEQAFNDRSHSETKQRFNPQPPKISGADQFQSFDREQNYLHIFQTAEARVKAESSPEPGPSLRSNFIAQKTQQHPSTRFISQYYVEADVEGRQPHGSFNTKYYDEAAGSHIWEMAYALQETPKPLANNGHQRFSQNTGIQKSCPLCHAPDLITRREGVEDFGERQTKGKFTQVVVDSSLEARPSPLINLPQAKASDERTKVEIPKSPGIYQTESFTQLAREKATPIPSTSSPIWRCPTNTDDHPALTSEKRKADNLNREPLDILGGSRKTLESPALRRSDNSEQALNAAQSRLAAAEKRKRELSQVLEKIDLCTKTRKLNKEAEQIEEQNLELQAQLNVLYNEDDPI